MAANTRKFPRPDVLTPGVHALAQVAHIDLDRFMEPFKIREAFNANLRLKEAPVVVLEVEPVNDDFHARFSAGAVVIFIGF